MIRTHCIAEWSGIIDERDDTLSCTINEALTYWNEATEPQAFIMTNEDDSPLCTMIRDANDYHIAHLLYNDGRKETYHVDNEVVTKL